MPRPLLRILDAIQLTRLTMAFGAVSDVWLIILITRAIESPSEDIAVYRMPLALALFVGATIAVGLFAYGASLNDLLDARHDSAFSPERPIPAGRIRTPQAIIMTVGALLVAILGGQAFGSWSLQLTLLTAMGILFYNAAGKFIPAVGIITIGLVHAVHMMIPNAQLTFTWPVWFVMSHAIGIALGAYVLEGKRPRISRAAYGAIAAGWFFWSAAIIAWGALRGPIWPENRTIFNLVWPLLALVAFVFIARWKTTTARGAVAAEKLKRYGAMWQALYGAAWLFALGLRTQALWIGLFAVFGFISMTIIKEITGMVNRPIAYRV